MNIFVVHHDPLQAAQDLPDKLVIKMPTESLQMLTPFIYNTFGLQIPKKVGGFYSTKGFANHPCSKWLYESHSNVMWLLIHAWTMCKEYTLRYEKTHGVLLPLETIASILNDRKINDILFPHENHTPFVQAMPAQCKNPDSAVLAYRGYLMDCKGYCEWKHTNPPLWWDNERFAQTRADYLNK